MPSYDIQYSEVITEGYHGTNFQSANEILKYGFKIGRNKSLRLGDGVYFYEQSYSNAFRWAERTNSKNQIAVLISRIKLGSCLNLTDSAHRDMVKEVARKIKNTISVASSNQITDALVINYICRLSDIDTVKAAFTSPKAPKLFRGSKLVEYQQIIICVRKSEQILSTSIVNHEVE
jgi:hypothetical protein